VKLFEIVYVYFKHKSWFMANSIGVRLVFQSLLFSLPTTLFIKSKNHHIGILHIAVNTLQHSTLSKYAT